MSLMPFSVRVGMRMEVPRKPVCRQLPCSSKFFLRRAFMLSLACPSTKSFLRANSAGVCIVLRMSVLKVPSALRNVSLRYWRAVCCMASYLAASRPVARAMSRIMPASMAQ